MLYTNLIGALGWKRVTEEELNRTCFFLNVTKTVILTWNNFYLISSYTKSLSDMSFIYIFNIRAKSLAKRARTGAFVFPCALVGLELR